MRRVRRLRDAEDVLQSEAEKVIKSNPPREMPTGLPLIPVPTCTQASVGWPKRVTGPVEVGEVSSEM